MNKKLPAGTLTRLFILLPWVLPCLSGCGSKSSGAATEKPAVIINKLKLTTEDLKMELLASSWSPHEGSTAKGQEPEWLSRLIERELLVQEAQHLGLDRRPDFMRTIERFWKEALIKDLLDRKGEEIASETHVYEPEIEASYQQQIKESPGQAIQPLSELRDEIRRSIQQRKETEAMEKWISGLRQKSQVVVQEEAIAQLK